MAKVNLKIEMAEINTYDIQVEVSDELSVKDQINSANIKVLNYLNLNNNVLIVGHGQSSDEVICCDREAATKTLYCSKIIPS